MRRREGQLLPLEQDILSAALSLRRRHADEFYGFQIAKIVQDESRAHSLTGHGTLYKALGRLEQFGLLTSRWEDPTQAASEHRPVRRLYQITVVGQRTLVSSLSGAHAGRATDRRPALVWR